MIFEIICYCKLCSNKININIYLRIIIRKNAI